MDKSPEWKQENPNVWNLKNTIDGISVSVINSANVGWGWAMLFTDSDGCPIGHDSGESVSLESALKVAENTYKDIAKKIKNRSEDLPLWVRANLPIGQRDDIPRKIKVAPWAYSSDGAYQAHWPDGE